MQCGQRLQFVIFETGKRGTLFSYYFYEELEWGKPLVSIGYLCRSVDGETFEEPELVWSTSHSMRRL